MTFSVNGIDVSGYQATDGALAGLSFVIAKASEGLRAANLYADHVKQARDAGLIVGAYHYSHSSVSVADQAAFFLTTAGDVDLYALDVEGPDAFTLAQCQDFVHRMHLAGKKIGMYHSTSGFIKAGQDWDWVADYRAAYATSGPPIPWDMWQYGNDGTGIDHNHWHGTLAELQALAGGTNAGGAIAMGFKTTLTDPPVAGVLTIPAGAKLYRLSDGAEYDYSGATVKRPAVKALSLPGSSGYIVNVAPNGVSEAHFTYAVAPVSFLPLADSTPYAQADLDAAVAQAKLAQQAADAAAIAAAKAAADLANGKLANVRRDVA